MSWSRSKPGLGTWAGKGKVAVVGWANSYVDRRWDGKDFTKTSGAKSMDAIRGALADAGLTEDDLDGLITCQASDTRAEQTWAPRPYFAPPYDSEDGIIGATGEWIKKQMNLKNIKYIDSNAGAIWSMMNIAADSVFTGKCKVAAVWYPMCNVEGRYGHNNPQNFSEDAKGGAVWNLPWGYQSGAMFNNLVAFLEYCKKYGKVHDNLGYLCLNQRRNGLRTPWGFYTAHEPYQLTWEDYRSGRLVEEPLVVYDCDRPMMTTAAFIFTTADRAKYTKGNPVYVWSHGSSVGTKRSTMFTVEEHQRECAQLAQVILEGAGITRDEVDVFNPYDGYLTFTQNYLEAFRWHGVGLGEAHDFYMDDIRVEGKHPFNSSGGNNGTGRSRAAHYFDAIEQLRGKAGINGTRTVNIKADVAVAGYGDMMCFGRYPK